MRINGRTLFSLIPDAADSISTGQAVSITGKRYCSRVHAAGYCTTICDNCCESVQAAFEKLNGVPDLKSPAGMLTYLMRDAATKYIESEREKEKTAPTPEVNWMGDQVEHNPFLQLLEV